MDINFVDPKRTKLGVASPIVADRYCELAIPTSVKGCHVYQDILEATIEEKLLCQTEMNNR